MRKELLVNIIVPVYNSADYILRCINSCLNQIYPYIKIIIVDDGSTDNSWNLINKYKNNPNIKLIHQENNGVSSARNKGIMECNDDSYIVFVDSDDYISNTYIQELVDGVSLRNFDFCCFSFIENNNLSFDDIIYFFMKKKICCFGPAYKIYKANICKQIMFNEQLLVGEDILFNVEYILKCKNIHLIHAIKAKYYYSTNYSSLTHSSNLLHMLSKLKSLLSSYICLLYTLGENHRSTNAFFEYFARFYLNTYGLFSRKDLIKFQMYSEIKKYTTRKYIKTYCPNDKKTIFLKRLYLFGRFILYLKRRCMKNHLFSV